MGLLPSYAPQSDLQRLMFNAPAMLPNEAYWRSKSKGTISKSHQSLGEKLTRAVSGGLQKAGLDKRTADKIGALPDLTTVGALTGAFDAGQQLRRGNLLSGSLGALSSALAVLPIPGPKGGMFGGKLRSILPHNDTGDGLDTIKSLAAFLTDPRPIHQMYEAGDMLSHKGEIGPVIHATDNAVVLDLPSGQRIVPRRDPDLDVAPYDKW